MSLCKVCGSNDISVFSEEDRFNYKGAELLFTMEYSICNGCEREFISKEQIKQNDHRIREAKKAFDGLLTSSEIRAIRKKLGLTQEQASTVFGGGKNAFSKYEIGTVSQSVAMDKLIRLASEQPEAFEYLKQLSE